MRVLQRCREFLALDADRRRLIVEAAALVGVIWGGLRFTSFATLRRALDACSNRVLAADGVPPSAIAWAVGAVGRRYQRRPTCLVEALAADIMLRRRQYPSVLHLGVRKMDNRSRSLDGHAWVECEGSIVVGHLDNLGEYAAGAWAAASPHPGSD